MHRHLVKGVNVRVNLLLKHVKCKHLTFKNQTFKFFSKEQTGASV